MIILEIPLRVLLVSFPSVPASWSVLLLRLVNATLGTALGMGEFCRVEIVVVIVEQVVKVASEEEGEGKGENEEGEGEAITEEFGDDELLLILMMTGSIA